MDHTFLMPNMTPQHCATNRGPWQVLEGLVRDWAGQASDTWIVTVAIYDRDGITGRDDDDQAWRMEGHSGGRRVAIPSQLTKVVGQWTGTSWRTLSVKIPNSDELIAGGDAMRAYLADHVKSLADVAEASGFRFFETSEPVEEASQIWPVRGRWPGPLTGVCKPDYPDR